MPPNVEVACNESRMPIQNARDAADVQRVHVEGATTIVGREWASDNPFLLGRRLGDGTTRIRACKMRARKGAYRLLTDG